jgi:hypothetical protein
MGNNPSSEASGVKCVECGCGLPQNNWSFVHLGDHGWVYVFYTLRHDSVTFKESVDVSAGFQNGKPGVNVGLGNERTMTEVKVIDYIRNRTKEDGYTCLTCLYNNCRAGYPGWDRVLREVNSLLRTHGIYVETRRFQTTPGLLFMTSG